MEKARVSLERTEIAQKDFESHINEEQMLVNVVVNQVQNELGLTLKLEPNTTPNAIKQMARARFLDLLNRELLTEREANKCYQRFIQMVDFYYGTS